MVRRAGCVVLPTDAWALSVEPLLCTSISISAYHIAFGIEVISIVMFML
jgi:hypothetical protein